MKELRNAECRNIWKLENKYTRSGMYTKKKKTTSGGTMKLDIWILRNKTAWDSRILGNKETRNT